MKTVHGFDQIPITKEMYKRSIALDKKRIETEIVDEVLNGHVHTVGEVFTAACKMTSGNPGIRPSIFQSQAYTVATILARLN